MNNNDFRCNKNDVTSAITRICNNLRLSREKSRMSFDNHMFPHLMRRYRGANIILFVLAIRIVSFIPSTDFVMQKKFMRIMSNTGRGKEKE